MLISWGSRDIFRSSRQIRELSSATRSVWILSSRRAAPPNEPEVVESVAEVWPISPSSWESICLVWEILELRAISVPSADDIKDSSDPNVAENVADRFPFNWLFAVLRRFAPLLAPLDSADPILLAAVWALLSAERDAEVKFCSAARWAFALSRSVPICASIALYVSDPRGIPELSSALPSCDTMLSLRETIRLSFACTSFALTETSVRAWSIVDVAFPACIDSSDRLDAPLDSSRLADELNLSALFLVDDMSFCVFLRDLRISSTDVPRSPSVLSTVLREDFDPFSDVTRPSIDFRVDSIFFSASSVEETASSRVEARPLSISVRAFRSWATTALLTCRVNSVLILPSTVEAPISVTLGAIGFSFSFT